MLLTTRETIQLSHPWRWNWNPDLGEDQSVSPFARCLKTTLNRRDNSSARIRTLEGSSQGHHKSYFVHTCVCTEAPVVQLSRWTTVTKQIMPALLPRPWSLVGVETYLTKEHIFKIYDHKLSIRFVSSIPDARKCAASCRVRSTAKVLLPSLVLKLLLRLHPLCTHHSPISTPILRGKI